MPFLVHQIPLKTHRHPKKIIRLGKSKSQKSKHFEHPLAKRECQKYDYNLLYGLRFGLFLFSPVHSTCETRYEPLASLRRLLFTCLKVPLFMCLKAPRFSSDSHHALFMCLKALFTL